jgi:[acyl-carrier-protein] S-malonyltransferase
MEDINLGDRLPTSAFAFRGYNIENLGRTKELLADSRYGPIFRAQLDESSQICSDIVSRRVDLIANVQEEIEFSLDEYDAAITLVMAAERAQIRCLREFHGIDFSQARLATGYSLGEIAALSECGIVCHRDALAIPLTLAEDCVQLARDIELGVLFSKQGALSYEEVTMLTQRLVREQHGKIGVSAILSPNTMLLMGQVGMLKEFKKLAKTELSVPAQMRINHQHWPPLHTPIVREKAIPNRAAVLMQSLDIHLEAPTPPVLSMVTGTFAYQPHNAREILHRWVDEPQRLWDVVETMLAKGIETVIHVGPCPNIIPATFKRLSENVELQTKGNLRMRALSRMARQSWLSSLLPHRTALLRAPFMRHVVLEDWLLK